MIVSIIISSSINGQILYNKHLIQSINEQQYNKQTLYTHTVIYCNMICAKYQQYKYNNNSDNYIIDYNNDDHKTTIAYLNNNVITSIIYSTLLDDTSIAYHKQAIEHISNTLLTFFDYNNKTKTNKKQITNVLYNNIITTIIQIYTQQLLQSTIQHSNIDAGWLYITYNDIIVDYATQQLQTINLINDNNNDAIHNNTTRRTSIVPDHDHNTYTDTDMTTPTGVLYYNKQHKQKRIKQWSNKNNNKYVHSVWSSLFSYFNSNNDRIKPVITNNNNNQYFIVYTNKHNHQQQLTQHMIHTVQRWIDTCIDLSTTQLTTLQQASIFMKSTYIQLQRYSNIVLVYESNTIYDFDILLIETIQYWLQLLYNHRQHTSQQSQKSTVVG